MPAGSRSGAGVQCRAARISTRRRFRRVCCKRSRWSMSFPTIAAMSIAWWACRRRRSAATTPRESPSPKPIFSENVEDVTECYERIVATGAPVLDPVPFLERWRGYRGAESLFLPLSNAGVAVNLILVFFDLEAVVRFTGPP